MSPSLNWYFYSTKFNKRGKIVQQQQP